MAFRTLRSIPLAMGPGFLHVKGMFPTAILAGFARPRQNKGNLKRRWQMKPNYVTPPGKDVTRMEIALRYPRNNLRKRLKQWLSTAWRLPTH